MMVVKNPTLFDGLLMPSQSYTIKYFQGGLNPNPKKDFAQLQLKVSYMLQPHIRQDNQDAT